MENFVISDELPIADVVVLKNLIDDVSRYQGEAPSKLDEGYASQESLPKKPAAEDEGLFPYVTISSPPLTSLQPGAFHQKETLLISKS